jgi:hypothetical protein
MVPPVPELADTVSISGNAQVGQTLTAVVSFGGSGNVSYQWAWGETDIPGATQETYTLTADDQGKTIRVRASRDGYAGSISSAPTAEVAAATAPELTGTVSISGNAQVGQTLTAVASLGGSGSVSYQWVRGEADISGATQATYTLTEADEGKTIRVRASRAGYAGSISSAPTAAVAGAPALIGTVSINGNTQVGQTLRANISLLGGSGSISYQWARGEADISGATQATYTLTEADEGKTIRVRASRAGYAGSISSAPTAAVAAATDEPSVPELTDTVSITGNAQVGQTLTAVASLGGSGSISYQWVRGETDISGATQATYTLTEADEGTAIRVRANRAGCAGSISSAPTATVADEPVLAEFTSVEVLKTYLTGYSGGTNATAPIPLKLSGVALSTADMTSLFTALGTAGKYVSLDLSGCTGLTAWAKYTYAGAGKIVSLALPDSVMGLAAQCFIYFTSLKTLTVPGIQTVGNEAFSNCPALTSASLPAAAIIGDSAFYQCTALASASLPAATAIGGTAFRDCTALASLTLGTTLPTISFDYTFYNAGKNTTAGFWIYVPTAQAKTALDAAIADTGSNWHKALKTTYIGNGRFKGVVVP